MKNVIEQIRKIKGVVTVDKAGENMFVGTFEAKPKPLAVRCENETQWKFSFSHINKSEVSTKFGSKCYDGSELYDTVSLIQDDGVQSHQYFESEGFVVIPFPKYIFDYNLVNEWTAFNKPKSLTPEELVDGRIYVDEGTGTNKIQAFPRIIRFKKLNRTGISLYSQLCIDGDYYQNSNVYQSEFPIRPATPSEAQSLIRAEIANNYFFELKDAK